MSVRQFDVVLLCILESSAKTPASGWQSRQLKREVDENIKFLTFLPGQRDTKYIQLDIFSFSVIFEGKFSSVATVVAARLIYKSKC